MIAAGINKREPQLDSSFANSLHFAVGDELPSLSCDLGEVNSTEFEQLLLQGLSDPFMMDMHQNQMQSSTILPSSSASSTSSQLGDLDQTGACDLVSFFLEDVPRPRDINLSFPGEQLPATFLGSQAEFHSDFKPDDVVVGGAVADSCNQLPSFLNSTPTSSIGSISQTPPFPPSSSSVLSSLSTTSAISTPSMLNISTPDRATPPHSGGVTPQHELRPSSPTWSESSGTMSCTSSSFSRQRSRHHSRSSVGSTSSNGGLTGEMYTSDVTKTASIPRHKRPSHKRAEIKRRDKIKTLLEDVKDSVPTICDKGKLSESAILLKVHSKKTFQLQV